MYIILYMCIFGRVCRVGYYVSVLLGFGVFFLGRGVLRVRRGFFGF